MTSKIPTSETTNPSTGSCSLRSSSAPSQLTAHPSSSPASIPSDLNLWEKRLRLTNQILGPLSLILIITALAFALVIAPEEKLMGAVQRIFYFHVGSAFACYIAFAGVFCSSLIYLWRRHLITDILNETFAEVGFVFCSITLITGMIWGDAAWNTPFRWEPRLVTFLFLWLIFLGFQILRRFGSDELKQNHSSILGILGSLMVPLVWYSIKLLPATAQLHPQVIDNQGLRSPLFIWAMLTAIVALVIFELFLIVLRLRIGLAEITLKRNDYN